MVITRPITYLIAISNTSILLAFETGKQSVKILERYPADTQRSKCRFPDVGNVTESLEPCKLSSVFFPGQAGPEQHYLNVSYSRL
jgi:hypothetical protein